MREIDVAVAIADAARVDAGHAYARTTGHLGTPGGLQIERTLVPITPGTLGTVTIDGETVAIVDLDQATRLIVKLAKRVDALEAQVQSLADDVGSLVMRVAALDGEGSGPLSG